MTDYKLTETAGVPAATAVTTDDIFYIVDSPGGTPADYSVTGLILSRDLSNPANGATVTTASGTVTLTDASNVIQLIDPDGTARDVALPTAATTNHGFIIKNTGTTAVALTVKSGATVKSVISRGESRTFISDGTTWQCLIGGYKQLWIGGFNPTVTSPCADWASIEMGTNKNVYRYLAFDKDTIEYAYANIPLPQDYSGGDVYFKPYWLHPATTTNFKVSWGLAGVAFTNDDTMDAAQGTAIYVNDTGGTTSDLYIGDLSAAVTLAGTPTAGKLAQFRVLRKADDAVQDTLAVDSYLLGIMVWYPVA